MVAQDGLEVQLLARVAAQLEFLGIELDPRLARFARLGERFEEQLEGRAEGKAETLGAARAGQLDGPGDLAPEQQAPPERVGLEIHAERVQQARAGVAEDRGRAGPPALASHQDQWGGLGLQVRYAEAKAPGLFGRLGHENPNGDGELTPWAWIGGGAFVVNLSACGLWASLGAVPVVTRYAPSPTGALHIGGARTALYSWAVARRSRGSFLLRFEDTDRLRSTEESEHAVLDALRWLGIDWDNAGDPVPRQSERGERYAEVLDELLAAGAAYRCTCPESRLDELRQEARDAGRAAVYDGACRERNIAADADAPFCVRLRIDADTPTRWTDEIAGPSGEDPRDLGDYVLARTDGTPIYHLACVVDDHDTGVTCAIRGREHLQSTSRQLAIYAALGWEPPAFAHVPLLVEASGKKLSKRDDAVSVQSYRARGFSPQAVLNFIARLGWGHGDLELFDREQLASLFDLKDVGRSESQVDDGKLLWISQHWMKTLPMAELIAQAQPFLDAEAGRPVESDPTLERLLDLLRERSKTYPELAAQARFFLRDEIEIDPKAARKHLKPAIAGPLGELRAALGELPDWKEESLDTAFNAVAQRHDLKLGKLAQPVRVAIVGTPQSPGIFETLAVLGRERSLGRIDAALRSMAD